MISSLDYCTLSMYYCTNICGKQELGDRFLNVSCEKLPPHEAMVKIYP